jgi:iron complex transport system substrate-binding protein
MIPYRLGEIFGRGGGWRLAGGLLVLALLMVACGDDEPEARPFNDNPTEIAGIPTQAAFPIEVERSDGQQLVVDDVVTRVVSLSPGATETIYALGAEAALIAVDNNADYPTEAASFPTRVDAFQPNIEAIAALEPDLVIVPSDIGGIVGALDRLNIPVLFIDLDTDVQSVDDVLGQIALMGRLTGTEERAADLVVDITQRVRVIEDGLRGLATTGGPSVYHELDSTFYTVSEQTFIGSLYRTLKARNIAGDGGGIAYPQLTQEAIIDANPEVIVLADEEFGVTIDIVKARPGWNAIFAVQNDQIYAIDPDIISRPGPRIVEALEQLAAQFYPQVFGETPAGEGTAAPAQPSPAAPTTAAGQPTRVPPEAVE